MRHKEKLPRFAECPPPSWFILLILWEHSTEENLNLLITLTIGHYQLPGLTLIPVQLQKDILYVKIPG